jgi:predicted alpha/beta hydrolase family esterase
MNPRNVLILPGWKNSGPGHWQTLWEEADGYTRVEQHSWMHPLRGDWTARLEDVLLSCDEPAVLVAHSLGCMLVAAWASHSRNVHRVKGALLVAPPDVERDDVREMLPSWAPVPLQKLPFDSVVFCQQRRPFLPGGAGAAIRGGLGLGLCGRRPARPPQRRQRPGRLARSLPAAAAAQGADLTGH